MDSASFAVGLVDKVSGPAKAAVRAIGSIGAQFDRMKKSADAAKKASEAAFRAKGFTQDKAGRWRDPRGKFVGDGKGPSAGGAFGQIGKFPLKTATKNADKAIDYMVDKAKSAAKWAAFGATAVAGATGYKLVEGAVHMARFKESSEVAFHSLTGSADGAQRAWDTSLRLARELGQDVEETTGSMKHLLAMQFKLPEAEELVKISADLQGVTGDAQAAHRALTAITQIKAKGKLQAEELVGQLAEANVSTVLVYKNLAKITGKSEEAVRGMISKGQIDADTGIAAIKAAILEKTHSSSAGQLRKDTMSNTFDGLIGQLKIAPQFLFVRLGEAVKKNLDKLKPVVERITKAIDGIQGDQMTRFIGKVLEMAERIIPLALEFATGFGEGFSVIVDAMGAADGAVPPLEKARALGKRLAEAFELALKAISKIADAVLWLADHQNLALFGAGTIGVLKLLGAGNSASLLKVLLGGGGGDSAPKFDDSLIGFGLQWATGKALAKRAAASAAATAAAEAAAAAAGAEATAAATTAAAGGGTTGLAALTAGLGTAGLLAGGGALAGLGLAGLSYAFREEIAQWGLDTFAARDEQQTTRGLRAVPTDAAKNLAANGAQKTTNNQIKFESAIHINGDGKDSAAIARDVGQAQKGMLEQFFQSQALEAGAM